MIFILAAVLNLLIFVLAGFGVVSIIGKVRARRGSL